MTTNMNPIKELILHCNTNSVLRTDIPIFNMIAVKHNGWLVQYVPKDLRNYNIYLVAVRQNGMVYDLVPDHFCSQYMRDLATAAMVSK